MKYNLSLSLMFQHSFLYRLWTQAFRATQRLPCHACKYKTWTGELRPSTNMGASCGCAIQSCRKVVGPTCANAEGLVSIIDIDCILLIVLPSLSSIFHIPVISLPLRSASRQNSEEKFTRESHGFFPRLVQQGSPGWASIHNIYFAHCMLPLDDHEENLKLC